MSDVLGIPQPVGELFFPFAVESIHLANGCAPSRWGLTPFDVGFRLNVGFCEVLTIGYDYARVIFHRDFIDNLGLPKGVEVEHHSNGTDYYYISAPGSSLMRVPLEPELLEVLLPNLRLPHNEIIKVAATRGFNRGSRAGHKDWVVDALSAATDATLPYPQYSPNYQTEPQTFALREGDPRLEQHMRLERSGEAPRRKKQLFLLQHGSLFCEACGDDLVSTYGSVAGDCLEVHHIVPLSKIRSGRVTTPEDLAILCPNCHTVIHRLDPIPSVESFKRKFLGE